MKIKLIPKDTFDAKSKNTISELINISDKILKKIKISSPKDIEFYNDLDQFIKRILTQVENYGLTRKQSIEFINASLNLGSYGTFDIKNNSIIEMNFNPYCKLFYPSIDFFKLLIHESLHLFLYSKLDRDIYKEKFKFQNGKYIGKKEIIQLDEGFAEFLTDEILKDFNFNLIKRLPIYSKLNKIPNYKKNIDGTNIEKLNKLFDELYEENLSKGYDLIKRKFDELEDNPLEAKILSLIEFVKQELDKLYEHK